MDQLTLTLHKTKDTKNKVTAKLPRKHQGRARRGESARDAERRGRVDVALLSVLRDGLLRRSEAAELRWGDLELQEDGSARLHVRRSKTDPEAEGVVLYIGQEATQALQAIMPEDTAVVDPARRVFELSASQIGRRIDAAAKAAGLGRFLYSVAAAWPSSWELVSWSGVLGVTSLPGITLRRTWTCSGQRRCGAPSLYPPPLGRLTRGLRRTRRGVGLRWSKGRSSFAGHRPGLSFRS